MVEFSDEEKTEYQDLEKEAKEFYINFRAIHGADITKHYLKISSKLMPLRVACAGGKYPINTAPQPEPVDDDMIEDETTKPRAPKRPKEYSKFIFESKFQYLIEELEEIRDEDPSSKCFDFVLGLGHCEIIEMLTQMLESQQAKVWCSPSLIRRCNGFKRNYQSTDFSTGLSRVT